MRKHTQEGFTLLEVLLVVSILSVLAMVAIPKFSQAMALANTAKVQADLQTIDTAIALYQVQNGTVPAHITPDLADYIVDAGNLRPPQGECLLRDGKTIKITDTTYNLTTDGRQALCQNHVSGDFGRQEAAKGS